MTWSAPVAFFFSTLFIFFPPLFFFFNDYFARAKTGSVSFPFSVYILIIFLIFFVANTQSILLVAGISFFFLFIGYVSSYGVSTRSMVCLDKARQSFGLFLLPISSSFSSRCLARRTIFFLSILFVYIPRPTRVLPIGVNTVTGQFS